MMREAANKLFCKIFDYFVDDHAPVVHDSHMQPITARTTNQSNMKTYTFQTYQPILDRWFNDSRQFASDADFRLYMYSLFNGNWKLISIK